MSRQSGQASIEWVATLLVVSIAFGAAVAAAPVVDGTSLGGLLTHRIVCTVRADCMKVDGPLREAYGGRDAALVRRYLPGLVYEPGERQLPVDWRNCRAVGCALASDGSRLDVHRTHRGQRVTAFTRLVRGKHRRYIQYWFYYPDSNSTFAGSDLIWKRSRLLQLSGRIFRGSSVYPGYHRDDWEAASVRLDRGGRVRARVTSHGHWQWCKWTRCKDEWGPYRGWTRVSRGSHAGHLPATDGGALQVPGEDLRERVTTPDGIRLIPLETLDRSAYRRFDPDIAPPWLKDAYRDPESPRS